MATPNNTEPRPAVKENQLDGSPAPVLRSARMNYYEHHLGDYLRDTAHLSMIEDGAYRRLIDAYYTRKSNLPLDFSQISRLVRAKSGAEKRAVKVVLNEFFIEQKDGWHHKRCAEEIAKFERRVEKARAAAEARWLAGDSDAPSMPAHAPSNAFPCTMPHTPLPKEEERPRKRGSRLPADWKPDEAETRYARERGLDPATVAEKFRNYWHAKSGNATKLDWSATWRNWCITEAERLPRKPPKVEREPTPAEIAETRRRAAAENAAVMARMTRQ